MSLTLNGGTPAMGLSIAFHIAAIVGAGMNGHHAAPAEGPPLEITLESEPVPPAPPPPEPPVVNEAPEPTVVKVAAVHHEAIAVHAVAATAPPQTDTPPANAPNARVSDDALPHFTIATSTRSTGGGALAKTSGTAARFEGPSDDDAPYAEGSVDVPARAARKVSPKYPAQARSGGLEATVKLEIVLSSAGVVEGVRAVDHPGHGFEEEAIAAARRTPFTPAMKRGRAVPVRMIWTVEFQLQ